MDGLITLFLIVMFFVKIFGKGKKKSGAAPGKVNKAGFGDAMKQLESLFQEQAEQPVVHTGPPEQPTIRAVDRKAELRTKYGSKLINQEGTRHEATFEGFSRPLAASEELAAGRAAGSLNFHSDEGMDACDPTLLHGESGLEIPPEPVFPAHAEDEPFLSAGDLVRGFVVSEILNRPAGNRYAKMR